MRLRPLAADDRDSLASLIHASLSVWYRANLNSEKFGADPAPFRMFPDLYEALDPGCCLVAEDGVSGRLAGSVFYHPRETHWAVGIVNTHPDFGGRGVAKQLMQAVIVVHPGMQMIGPGVMEDETAAIALLHAVLDAEFRGRGIVWLVPVHGAALVRQCYAWGARNAELHLGSVLGNAPPISGVTFPTFMPETG